MRTVASMHTVVSCQVADERSIGDQLATVAGLLAVEGEHVVGHWLDRIGRRLERVTRTEVDEFGYDAAFTTAVALPAARALATRWFRTTVRGADALPDGPALLVANHAGTLPLDGAMIQLAVHDADPANRVLRMLAADRMFATPVLGELTRRMGATLACAEDVDRLLAAGHLVLVFPEGFKGIGKPYRDRYRLQRFGRGGFVAAALRAKVPIVPVAVVGSEEIYPKLGEIRGLAELLSVPYFPITPTWPWLGPLGMVPLPSRWVIDVGAAIPTEGYPDDAADDPSVVLDLTDAVRQRIQQRLHELLAERGSAF
jgi:1-acyl-sn-glycerol-3-phosphate acyltransferase